jgi:peroxiredoxin
MSKETLPALLALALAVPLAYLFVRAADDGEVRRHEGPLRAMLGNATYDTIVEGHTPEVGYFGDDRLAPDFTLRDAEGSPWRLSDRRGKKVVVMNFWSTTCSECVEEMPSIESLARTLGRNYEDVELVAISTDPDWATVGTVIPQGTQIHVLLDPDRAVVRGKYGTRLFPETWIIDKDGIIRARIDGARDWSAPLALDLIELYR